MFWLRRFEQLGLVPHHLITDDVRQMPPSCQAHAALLSGRAMLVKRLKMLPVEAVIRGYITGSGWADYTRTGAVCGITLPAGLRRCDRLPNAVYTPSTKAELGEHDAKARWRGGDWRKNIWKAVMAEEAAAFPEVITKPTPALSAREHQFVWSWVDYLMARDAAAMGKALKMAKMEASTRDILKECWGISTIGFETGWAEWVSS